MRKLLFVSALIILALTASLAGCGQAEEPAPPSNPTASPTPVSAPTVSFPNANKPIEWIITYPPGGAFDVYARALVPYLSKYLGTDVVVLNVEGGGGVVGALQAYRSTPDGYTIVFLNIDNFLIEQSTAGLPFEPENFAFISQVAINQDTMAVNSNAPYDDITGMKAYNETHQLRACVPEPATEQIYYHILGFDYVNVSGFQGSVEAALGVVRGDGDMVSYTAGDLSSYVEAGDIKPIIQAGDDPGWSKLGLTVPSALEEGYPELALLGSPRLVAAPPGTPAEIVNILDEAFKKALSDPEVIAWSESSGRGLKYANAQQSIDATNGLKTLFAKYQAVLNEIIGGG